MLILASTAGGGSASSAYSILALIAACIAILGAVAAAVAYTRTQYAKSTIEALKENNAALTESLRLCEDRADKSDLAVAALQQEAENLRGYVSGTEAIEALGRRLSDEHIEVMARITEVIESFGAHLVIDHPRKRPTKKTTATTTTRSKPR